LLLGTRQLFHARVTLVVQGVPAEICDNYGGGDFDEVTRRLLSLVREAVAAGVVVDVHRYVAT